MFATPVYAVVRLAGLAPFPTAPIILRTISVLGALASLIVLYNFASRHGMRWAGLLAAVYLMTDNQFGMWTRMAHPDTLQVLFAVLALVIGLQHADRGDLASLAALGLMCGFVQGAKAGGSWTVPMAFLSLLWGMQAAEHKFYELKPLVGRCVVLGSGALFGYFISTPYAFLDPYLFRSYWLLWNIQGLAGSTDGPFGRITFGTWVQAIYAHSSRLRTKKKGLGVKRRSITPRTVSSSTLRKMSLIGRESRSSSLIRRLDTRSCTAAPSAGRSEARRQMLERAGLPADAGIDRRGGARSPLGSSRDLR
jgi:hypothetical protein